MGLLECASTVDKLTLFPGKIHTQFLELTFVWTLCKDHLDSRHLIYVAEITRYLLILLMRIRQRSVIIRLLSLDAHGRITIGLHGGYPGHHG